MSAITHELRLALRRLLQAPGFSLAVLGMLALGIALSTSMIGVLRGVLGSLPFPQAEHLVVVEGRSAERDIEHGGLTPAEALKIAGPDSPFVNVGYFDWNSITLLQQDRPREITVFRVSAGFFPTLGMPALHGRWLGENEIDGVVLSQAEWQRVFGGDPAAIGRSLETTEGRLQVVGVMPQAFNVLAEEAGAWRLLPATAYPLDQPWTWHARFVNAVARIDPSLAEGEIEQRLDRMAEDLAERHALPAERWQLRPRALLEVVVGEISGVLWAAMAVALLVLLIACANAAILVDARQVARRHEQAVAQALGASRQRVLIGLLLELGLLTSAAVLLGWLLALLGMDALREVARSSLPRVDAIALDAGALAIAAALGLLVPLMAGAAGALAPRGAASEAMRGGGKGVIGAAPRRVWLPAVGVALSTVSLVAGSALVYSLWQLQAVDPGHRYANVYALQMFHNGEIGHSDFAQRMREQLLAVPGVEGVAFASSAPLASQIGVMRIDLKLPARAQPEPWEVALRRVSPDYGSVLRIPLLRGRMFDADDRFGGEKVAIINRELARRAFGTEDAIGQSVELPLGNGPRIAYRIVGVSEDTRNEGLRAPPAPELWLPFAAEPSMGMSFLVAAGQPLANYERLFADALHAVDSREAATLIAALSEARAEQLAPARFFARTVGGFALAALLLAAFGIYAVAALRQRQRTAEFGLRLVVGASPRRLIGQMLGESVRAVAVGIGFGLAGAWVALRVLQAQLFGVEGAQLGVVGVGVLTLLLAALLAALLPALRVARIDPSSAMRHG